MEHRHQPHLPESQRYVALTGHHWLRHAEWGTVGFRDGQDFCLIDGHPHVRNRAAPDWRRCAMEVGESYNAAHFVKPAIQKLWAGIMTRPVSASSLDSQALAKQPTVVEKRRERNPYEPDSHWSFDAPTDVVDLPRICRESLAVGSHEVMIRISGLEPIVLIHASAVGVARAYATAQFVKYAEEASGIPDWFCLPGGPILAKARTWRAQQKKLPYQRVTVVGVK